MLHEYGYGDDTGTGTIYLFLCNIGPNVFWIVSVVFGTCLTPRHAHDRNF